MKGIFIEVDNLRIWTVNEIDEDLTRMGITDVFVFSGGRDDRLLQLTNQFHKTGKKVHLCLDCFSGGGNEELTRWVEIINEVIYAKENYDIDGVNLDAIRYWQPKAYDTRGIREDEPCFSKFNVNHIKLIKDWVKFTLGDWNHRCGVINTFLEQFKKFIKGKYPDFLISVCTKAELFGNFKTLNFLSRMYGQDHKQMANYVDFITPMTYKNLYCNGLLKYINWNYNPALIAKEIHLKTICPITPILWAYNNPAEYSYNRMPTKDELQSSINDCHGNCVLFLYKDMKTIGKNLLEVRL